MAVSEELIKVAARIVFQQLAMPYRAALERRFVGAAICGVLALIIIIAAVACGIGAFWLWLTPQLGAGTAALVTMAVLVVIALILALAAIALARRSPGSALHDVFDSKELSSLVEKHLPELVIAAAIGGLIFGMKRRK
jgi:uncharacterized membrane protein YedE/YeeE